MGRLRDTLFGALYRLAFKARAVVWEIQRPTLLGVRALVVRGDEVLLIRHRAGERPWSLPGGGVDQHERWVEAARREVYEEAGMPVVAERLQGMYEAYNGALVNYIAVFVCAPQGEPRPPESIEVAEVRYFPLRALPDGLEDGSRRRIAEYLQGAQGVAELW